ncbi:hypothetical protein [Siccirubricoccus deserti]|uniref:hypothetical protein n=1 Tax=Siccirubricoccus deserti TaxID=2013562 RepID=UPI001C94AD19|nr:hypothetical protein [Siccirubricoccus deserti]
MPTPARGGWTSRDKFAAVLETAALNEADLATYCRQWGLYPEQIQTWRTACEQANDWERASSQSPVNYAASGGQGPGLMALSALLG